MLTMRWEGKRKRALRRLGTKAMLWTTAIACGAFYGWVFYQCVLFIGSLDWIAILMGVYMGVKLS